jgi:hypothetical protein
VSGDAVHLRPPDAKVARERALELRVRGLAWEETLIKRERASLTYAKVSA